ncbi:MAG: hypothetical protein H0T89_16305 [Deltaproteobacteria bacterium]|nr:hypothetical protein [Deltaproteobacteria bacterium]
MIGMLDLREAGRATAIALPDLVITDVDREAAIAEWRGRMVNEHVSARVFAQLIPQLMRAGLPADVQANVADMVAQELRHGRLCAGVVEALGGAAVIALPELADVPAHGDATPVEAVLRNVLAISCLEETVAVALLETGRQLSEPAPIRAVVTEILRDEIGHAKLGWQLARALLPGVERRTRERLSEYLVPAFRQLVERHWVPDELPLVGRRAVPAIGVDDAREASRLVLDVIGQVIVPGLEAYGLEARDALAEATM